MLRIPSVSLYVRITDDNGRRRYERVKQYLEPDLTDRVNQSLLSRQPGACRIVNKSQLPVYRRSGIKVPQDRTSLCAKTRKFRFASTIKSKLLPDFVLSGKADFTIRF